MKKVRAIALALFAFVSLFACAKKEAAPAESPAPPPAAETQAAAPAATTTTTAAPPPAAAAPAAIATADGERSGVTLAVQELKRTSGGTVSLKFSITNGSTETLDYGYNFGDKDRTPDYGSLGGIVLIDEANKKKYFVVRDSEGECVCSRGLKDQQAGETRNLWARFPAPPDDVQRISVVVPHFSPLDDVPLSR